MAKLTEKKIRLLAEAYQNGESLEALSQRANISRPTLTKYLRQFVEIRRPGEWKGDISNFRKKRGPEWDEMGKITDQALAEKLGCSRQNVTRVRTLHGIPSLAERNKCET